MEISRLFSLARTGQTLSGRFTSKSVMTPMAWICGVATPPCFTAAFLFKDNLAFTAIFAGAGIIPILVACGMYVYFALCDPDRLHSEDYRLRTRLLELTEVKGGTISFAPMDLMNIANPYPEPKAIGVEESPKLPKPGSEGSDA